MWKAAIVLSVALVGCASKPWHKAGGDWDADFGQCRYEAALATPGGTALEAAFRQRELITLCLQNKGWRQ